MNKGEIYYTPTLQGTFMILGSNEVKQPTPGTKTVYTVVFLNKMSVEKIGEYNFLNTVKLY